MSDIKINKAIADAYASMYAPKQEEEAPVVQEEAPEVQEEPSDLEEGKKLDPVGKEDGDIDNDGDEDEADKYLARRRKTIAKILKKKKDVKEKAECPKCEGEGCDHCDGKGYHESSCNSKKKMTEVEEPRAKGEKDFKDKHTVKVSADLEEKKYKAPTQAEIDADKKKDKKGKARPSMSAKSASKSVYKNMMGGLKD